jgi:hypothetical protein
MRNTEKSAGASGGFCTRWTGKYRCCCNVCCAGRILSEHSHLALCYNRPLSLLDVECSGLLQPLDDNVWQAGEFFVDSAQSLPDSTFRRRGPTFECTGHSIFGFFLPLMTILGEIVDLNYARNHPRFGTKTNWEDYASEISQQLVTYGQSLQELRDRAVNEANAEAHEPVHPGTPSRSLRQFLNFKSSRLVNAC